MAEESEDHTARFTEAINRNGFAFAQAIAELAEQMAGVDQTKWELEATEFPVEIGGHGSRIDLMFWIHRTGCWLLAECKRVNPKYNDWLFLPSKHVRRQHTDRFIFDSVGGTPPAGQCLRFDHPIGAPYVHTAYCVPRPIDAKDKGKGSGSDRDAIEDAASQICRGANGMLNMVLDRPEMLGPNKRRMIFPVIFTTARLFVASHEADAVDYEHGVLDESRLKYDEKGIVFYQYHLSPGIKFRSKTEREEPSFALAADFIRTIPIVNSKSIPKFLQNFRPDTYSAQDVAGI